MDDSRLPEKPPDYPCATLIRQHLLLGSIFDAQDASLLSDQRVGHVLYIGLLNAPRPGHDLTCGTSKLNVDDDVGEDLALHFHDTVTEIAEILDRLQTSDKRLLVHCEYGISRSAAVVVAYLMAHENIGAKAALLSVRDLRPLAFSMPDPAFFAALIAWQNRLSANWTIDQRENTELLASASELLTVLDGSRDMSGEGAGAGAGVGEGVGGVALPAGLKAGEAVQGEGGGSQLSDAVIKHKNHIAESILTLHCPECDMAFLDFTNCFALWCARCNCAFCAYCQKSCRREYNDAHRHVFNCEFNIAPRKSIFANFATFEKAQNQRRVREVSIYLDTLELSLQGQVMDAIRADLTDLGIDC